MSRLYLFPILILVLASTNACSDNDRQKGLTGAAQSETAVAVREDSQKQLDSPAVINNKLITKAKLITTDYKLSPIKQECLTYEVQKNKFEGKRIIDVREIHSESCGGDTGTTPRLFTIAIVETTGEVWSDAKSLLGQLEKLDKP